MRLMPTFCMRESALPTKALLYTDPICTALLWHLPASAHSHGPRPRQCGGVNMLVSARLNMTFPPSSGSRLTRCTITGKTRKMALLCQKNRWYMYFPKHFLAVLRSRFNWRFPFCWDLVGTILLPWYFSVWLPFDVSCWMCSMFRCTGPRVTVSLSICMCDYHETS